MTEQDIIQIIASAGTSKSIAFDALGCVKEGNYDEARDLVEQARKADLEAHNIQTKLIQQEMASENVNHEALTLLVVHAQDHYMSAQLTRDLVSELIDVFEALENRVKE